MEHFLTAKYKHVLLRPVHEDDLELLRVWRNDKSNTTYLSKLEFISSEMQLEWYKRDLKDTNCYTFAIEECENLKSIIGSVALYNFKGNQAEFGRALIGHPDARGKGMGFFATVLCLHIGFTVLNVEIIVASVHEDNISANRAYEKSGFVVKGKHSYEHGGFELDVAVNKSDFLKKHDFLMQIERHE